MTFDRKIYVATLLDSEHIPYAENLKHIRGLTFIAMTILLVSDNSKSSRPNTENSFLPSIQAAFLSIQPQCISLNKNPGSHNAPTIFKLTTPFLPQNTVFNHQSLDLATLLNCSTTSRCFQCPLHLVKRSRMVPSHAPSSSFQLRLLLSFVILLSTCHINHGMTAKHGKRIRSSSSFFHNNSQTSTLWWSAFLAMGKTMSSTRDLVTHNRMYGITADLKPLPNQPKLMVQILFSVIISESNFTNPINKAIIDCISSAVSTKVQHIGLFNAELFTRSTIQAEFYADIMENDLATFPEKLDTYIRQGNLTECVHKKDVGLAIDSALFSGRTTIAPRTESIVSSIGSIPGWTVGAVIGVLALISLVGLLVLSAKGNRIIPDSAYQGGPPSHESSSHDLEGGDIPEHVQREILEDIKNIAG